MNTKPILHHFEISPFSEKVRLVFGFKRLAWRSVLIPPVLPKPDVIALTGGYRRTPLLQIGADIYCDTALALRVIDGLQPEPPLFPPAAALAPAVAAWADASLFWQAIGVTQHPAARARIFEGLTPEQVQAFATDRAAFVAGLKRPTPPDAAAQFEAAVQMFERALALQPWLTGREPSIADFAVYHCLWFVRLAGLAERLLQPHAALSDWFTRMSAFGHGLREEIGSLQAIEEAAGAKGHAPVAVQPGLGFEAGEAVSVAAIDYGTDAVAGTLVGLSIDSVTLQREDARAGHVHVHFPRFGYRVQKASNA
jgi:glutathione S-transferase